MTPCPACHGWKVSCTGPSPHCKPQDVGKGTDPFQHTGKLESAVQCAAKPGAEPELLVLL